jgi:NTE family protein
MHTDGERIRKTAVIFSSGFFGFYAHAGFLAALREVGIRPGAWAGTSAGAIVAAFAASGTQDERIRDFLFRLRKEDFWDPHPLPAVMWALARGFKGFGGYLKGERFLRLMREALPVKTFEECADPLVVAATDLNEKKEKIFTRGDLPLAVCASCAVPMLFRPVEAGGSMCVDGGVTSKAPISALISAARPDKVIIHYIASRGLEGRGNGFLRRPFTPWFIHDMAFDIARLESYRHQKALAEAKGIMVMEIDTKAPALGPGSLERGRSAYEHARLKALKALKRLVEEMPDLTWSADE